MSRVEGRGRGRGSRSRVKKLKKLKKVNIPSYIKLIYKL